MNAYKFKYKCGYWPFFRSLTVIGHRLQTELDRMTLYFADGGIQDISSWSCCDCKLGSDWALAVKKEMEAKAGQPVIVNRELDAN